MGKTSRRPSRRNRAPQVRARVEAGQLKIVIATAPKPSGDGEYLDMASDLRLVRSALLYADVVELLSPGVAMFTAMREFSGQGMLGLIDLLSLLDDTTLRRLTGGKADLDKIRAFAMMASHSYRSPSDTAFDQLVAEQLDKVAPGMLQAQQELATGWTNAGGDDITAAAESGVLRLSQVPLLQGEPQQMVTALTDELKNLLANPRAHLLLDDDIAHLAGLLVTEGHVEPHQLVETNILKSRTGAGLVAQLPAFETSPIQHILTARTDLSDPLTRYRRAVVTFSDKLHSTPYDNAGLDAELDDLWHDEIEPALTDLRKDLSTHDLIRDWIVESATDIQALVAGAVTVAGAGILMGAGVLPDVSNLFAGAAVPPAVGLAKTLKERAPAKRNDLFYLHQLGRKL